MPDALTALAGTYSQPARLDPETRIAFAAVDYSVSDRGLVKLEQDGKSIILTPAEMQRLVALAG